jgi:hypothetical protein
VNRSWHPCLVVASLGIAMKWSGLKQMSLGLVTCVAYKSHACGVDGGFSNILSAGGSMAGVCRAEAFPQEGDCSEDVGMRGFSGKISRSHKRRSHTFSSHRYNTTEITISTPQLTRIIDRLIGSGISLCGDVV